ncbi:glycosyltransferase family 2 protein [Treponema lecithinolyticum]|nr:glycosyltransferase family 2 protein [Treponema lecithinolyticum]
MTVSIVTPTLNSMRTLDAYFNAIMSQNYPHAKIEIIIADGGSTDGTREKIVEFQRTCDISIKLYENPLKTAEAGKAVGVRNANNDIVCLLDSDNILPDATWLERMLEPFSEQNIIATEPIAYTWRKEDHAINRYCALIGMNDPICLFTGNYDRYCSITNKWTEVKHEEKDRGNYLSVKFFPDMIPTIGANGFCIRKETLLANFTGDYLFDIDILWQLLQKNPECRIAKVKIGIVHLYCADITTFYRKQNRRICDFLFFRNAKERTYPWTRVNKIKIVWYIFCCITVLPLMIQAAIGFIRKQDGIAWLFHIPICLITLWVYGIRTLQSLIAPPPPPNRKGWHN